VHEHLAATDVPALARAVAHPENDVHGTKVMALARDLTSRLDPGALAARPAWDRLLQHLIARGDRDSLVELVVARENGAAPRAHMAGRWKKRWELRLPGHHLGEVAPPVVLAVRPDEIFLRASVMDVRSTKTQIVLTVTAGLGCDLGDNAIVECWL